MGLYNKLYGLSTTCLKSGRLKSAGEHCSLPGGQLFLLCWDTGKKWLFTLFYEIKIMLFYYHNKITSNYQYFRVDHITDHMNPHCHTRFTSLRTVKDFFCSHGQSRMYSYRAFSVLIKDFPNLPKEKKYIEFSGHRFRCISCGESITEDINALLRALPGKWPGGSSTY